MNSYVCMLVGLQVHVGGDDYLHLNVFQVHFSDEKRLLHVLTDMGKEDPFTFFWSDQLFQRSCRLQSIKMLLFRNMHDNNPNKIYPNNFVVFIPYMLKLTDKDIRLCMECGYTLHNREPIVTKVIMTRTHQDHECQVSQINFVWIWMPVADFIASQTEIITNLLKGLSDVASHSPFCEIYSCIA